MLKKIFALLSMLFVIFACYYGYAFYENNKNITRPDTSRIQAAYEKSLDWLEKNYLTIKNNHNPALWWMIKESTDISDNKKLADIYARYQDDYLNKIPPNIWTPYFRKYYKPVAPNMLAMGDYAPYQKFFVYALSCDKNLAKASIIQDQFKTDFCGLHYLRPRCVTHQLMSVMLMQERFCGDDEQLDALSGALQKTIEDELTWDIRVTDTYLQRVLMLAVSGDYKSIKPVWVQHVLDAQNDDGSWDDLHPLFPLGNSRYFGWTSILPAVREIKSDFHATAQGVWLMALLLHHQQTESDNNSNP